MADRDRHIVLIQKINLAHRQELRLVDGGNAVAVRTALEDVIDLNVNVILGKVERLEQDIGFIAAGIACPGLCGIAGQRRKRQQ